MNGGIRHGFIKLGAVTWLLGGLFLAASIAASATIPAPGTVKTAGNFEFSNVSGYTAPGPGSACGAYSSGASFNISVNVWNKLAEAQDQAFNLQLYKMADLATSTCYSEAQLEAMVLNGQKATETLVTNTNTQTYHFVSKGSLTVSASGTGTCGYYQFDLGLAGTGSFAPHSGYAGPPVSGFVLFNGPTCTTSVGVSGVTVSPSPTATTTTTTRRTATSSSGTGAGTLANTGGGPAPLAPYGLLLGLGLASVIGGARLLKAQRPGR